MPKVPVYDQQVQAHDADVRTNEVLRAPQQAFGADVAEAQQRLAGTVVDDAGKLGEHMAQRQVMQNEQQVLATETKARQDMQNLLYSQQTDQNGVPTGFLNREKDQAAGATPQFDQVTQALKQKYSDTLTSDLQKNTFSKLFDTHAESMRNEVIKHEAQQGRAAYQDTFDANLKQRVADAGSITDPDEMNKAIDDAKMIQASGLQRLGTTNSDVIGVKNQFLAADMVKSSFDSLIGQDYRQAKGLLDGVRDKLPGSVAADMDKALAGKLLDDKQTAVWNNVKDLALADGTPDQEKMQAAVQAMDLPNDQKDKVWTYVKARAGELDQQAKAQGAADDHTFADSALQMKKQGKTLDEALRLVPNFGGDNVDQKDRADAITKIYTSSAKTDPQTYVQIWEGVHDGTMGKTEINQALAQDKLSGADWRELMETKYNAVHKDDSFMQKEMVDHVKDRATAEFGNSPSGIKQRSEFMYNVLINSRGKTPEETWKISNDLLKKDPTSGWIPLTQDSQYQTDIKNRDAQNALWGQLHQDIGQDAVKAIGQGALYSGKDKWGVGDVNSFANALGGMDNLKKGTPANNAIQSLIKNKKVVTPSSVKAVLSQHPDGVWTK